MCVLSANKYFKFHALCTTKRVMWQHTFYRSFDKTNCIFLTQLTSSDWFQSAWVHWVFVVDLVRSFFTSQFHFFSVDNDYEIASVSVLCELWFVFTAKDACNNCLQTSQRNICRINNVPFTFNFAWFSEICSFVHDFSNFLSVVYIGVAESFLIHLRYFQVSGT